MKPVRWLALMLCVLCVTPGVAQPGNMTWDDYGTAYEQEWFRIYGHGVGDGLMLANSRRLADGEKPLFCVPGILALTADDYRQILDDYLKALIKKPGAEPVPNVFVEGRLLSALLSAFPCEKR